MRLPLLSAAAAASVVAFAVPAFATSGCNAERGEFSDMWGCHSYFPAIAYVEEEGIVEGYPDGTFKPEQPVNRAEFTKILMGTLDEEGPVCKIAPFKDVDQSAWYAPFVHKARCRGIIDGYSDGTFEPGSKINYAEAAKIAANAYGLSIDPADASDWEGGQAWYLPYSLALLRGHAVPPTVDRYDHPLTRGEMVEMIYRLETGKTSFEWFEELPDGDNVTLYSLLGESDVEISYPGSLFAMKESFRIIPDIFTDGGMDVIPTVRIAYVRPDESEQGCDGMSGVIGNCRPSKSDLVIDVGIVDRTVEHLALGMPYADPDDITEVSGRPARSFWEGVECEGRKYVFVPLDATRSLAIMRSFNCNDSASSALQEERFSVFLENIRFQKAYVPQDVSTMEISLLLCPDDVYEGSPGYDVPSVRVLRTVPKSTSLADSTIRALYWFEGNPGEGATKCQGLASGVLSNYRGVSIENGVATVGFRRAFKDMFHVSTFAESLQRSISANLKQFPTVRSVRYVVQP